MDKEIEEQVSNLENRLSATSLPSERAEILNELAIRLRFIDVDRSERFAREALLISNETGNLLQKSRALRLIASSEDIRNNYKEALNHILEAKAVAESVNAVEEIIACNNLLGKLFLYLNDLPAALKIYQQNASLSQQTGNQILQADALLTQAVVHFRNNDFSICRPMFEESLAISRKIGYEGGIGRGLLNLSATCIETKKFEEGFDISSEAIPFFEKNQNMVDLAHALSNNGTACVALGRYEEAEKRFLEVRKIRFELNDVVHLPNSFVSTAEIFIQTGRFEEALKDLQAASRFAEKLENKLIHVSITEMYFRYYEAVGNETEALRYHKEYFRLSKDFWNEERNRDLGNLRLRFEFDKVQEEKELYRLHSIEVEEANRMINEQKELIEEKNKDITDSIHYAHRIQKAMLPLEEEFRELFPDSFVIYKPKDIISGDFYWCKKAGDALILAVADCTGHGVPGALMSMIGNNLLSQAQEECGNDSPATILELLDKRLRKILKQESDEGGGNDGMDIALCIIRPKEQLVLFSGAKRPLWILREGEILETKGDRDPVGGKLNTERHFSNQRIELKKGDTLYLFSDGYADQFGGPEEKKFQTGRMKKIIAKEFSDLNAVKTLLENEWESWRGKLDQVDDVLMIGVRV